MKWKLVQLGDAVSFRGGGTPRKDVPEYWADEIPWATVKDFKSLTLSCTQDSISRKGLESSASNLIPAGHVIIPTRMALGKAAINSIDLAINQDLRALIPKKKLDPVYLLHSMLGLAETIERNGSGATVKGITQKKLANLQIPLPPLAEQKRIAAILDAADALRAKRRETLAQLNTLLQSAFLDMFGDPVTNPMGWEKISLGDVLDVKGGYAFKSSDYLENSFGAPLIRIGEVNRCEFDSQKLAQLPKKYLDKHQRYVVRNGAILMSLTGTVGKNDYGNAIMLNGNANRYLLNQRVAELIPTSKLNSFYLQGLISHERMKRRLTGRSRGVRQANISNGDITQLQIPLPPLDLQHRFATIVESVEKQKSRLRAHLAELDTLFASLQSRAFNGEL